MKEIYHSVFTELNLYISKWQYLHIFCWDYCRDFCEKNDEMTMGIMEKMFAGISEEQLQATIRTIVHIEDNLKKIN